ncbi:unnamed protein product [Symbiodinium sp. CCMP2592]|nr:unnamed protein product [Symbiodinium sp. CCMP2592]
MAKRKSKADSQASIARFCKEGASPDDGIQDPEVHPANEALEQFREAKAWLEKQGCWMKAGSPTEPMQGLMPMPTDWSGANCAELKRCVIGLGDIDWDDRPGMAVAQVTVSHVLEARRFWFPDGTISEMPDVMVMYGDETQRGQLRLQSNCARLMAFVMEWAEHSKNECYALPCILVQAAPDSLESFWLLHKRGEEVIATCRADAWQL